MDYLHLAVKILGAIGSVWSVLFAYRAIFFLVGVFKTRTFPETERKHRYAIVIPARNEAAVIENLLDSIANQDYPLDKLTVFVMANNCTDDTAARARAHSYEGLSIAVYERTKEDERTKGFALQYLFEKIDEDYGIEHFDGYFIFDADNVMAKNYITKMNEAFDAGNKIVTSFRSSKNIHQNHIAFSYAMHWMRTCLTENRGKSVLKQACRVQGTGFLFAAELVKDGWHYTSLTEDRSFCSDAVVKNYRISYCDEAIFYDEQPYRLKVALRQRIRWAKGHLQSAVENCPKLLKNMVSFRKSFTIAYDCFFLNFPRHIESVIRKLLTFSLKIAITLLAADSFGWLVASLIAFAVDLGIFWLKKIATALLVLFKYRKRITSQKGHPWRYLWHMLLFPFFDIIGKWAMYLALFQKVEWKPIPHDRVMDVSKL